MPIMIVVAAPLTKFSGECESGKSHRKEPPHYGQEMLAEPEAKTRGKNADTCQEFHPIKFP